MQCETKEGGQLGNKLIVDTAKKMWKTGGLGSYYRGLTWGLIGQFPYSAIDLFTFESLKNAIIRRNIKRRGCGEGDAAPGPVATAAIGGFSGAFGATLVYPINLLRTRLQTQGTKEHPRTYTGIVDCTRQTIQGEGVRGLFKGVTPNLIKVVPAVSIVSGPFRPFQATYAFANEHAPTDVRSLRRVEKGTSFALNDIHPMIPLPCT